jgi:hypothetical protein
MNICITSRAKFKEKSGKVADCITRNVLTCENVFTKRTKALPLLVSKLAVNWQICHF